MSPAATCEMPRRTATRDAWVPLPLPGGPNIKAIIWRSLDESLVLAHQQLGLDLFHGVEGHADDDEDGRAAEVEAGRGDAGEDGGEQRQHHRDHRQEERAGEGDPPHDLAEILGGAPPGAYARDERR